MQINYLIDELIHLPQISQWHHAQWGHLEEKATLERRRQHLLECSGRETIPTCFVAVEDDQVMGSASIVHNDLSSRPDLSPWLASVYVGETYRNRGVGSALVQRIVAEAQKLRVDKLYLITPDRQSFYTRLGWKSMEDVFYRGEQVTMMFINP